MQMLSFERLAKDKQNKVPGKEGMPFKPEKAKHKSLKGKTRGNKGHKKAKHVAAAKRADPIQRGGIKGPTMEKKANSIFDAMVRSRDVSLQGMGGGSGEYRQQGM